MVELCAHLNEGDLAKSTASNNLQLVKVDRFQVQLLQLLQVWLDELAELLLLLAASCGDDSGRRKSANGR